MNLGGTNRYDYAMVRRTHLQDRAQPLTRPYSTHKPVFKRRVQRITLQLEMAHIGSKGRIRVVVDNPLFIRHRVREGLELRG